MLSVAFVEAEWHFRLPLRKAACSTLDSAVLRSMAPLWMWPLFGAVKPVIEGINAVVEKHTCGWLGVQMGAAAILTQVLWQAGGLARWSEFWPCDPPLRVSVRRAVASGQSARLS